MCLVFLGPTTNKTKTLGLIYQYVQVPFSAFWLCPREGSSPRGITDFGGPRTRLIEFCGCLSPKHRGRRWVPMRSIRALHRPMVLRDPLAAFFFSGMSSSASASRSGSLRGLWYCNTCPAVSGVEGVRGFSVACRVSHSGWRQRPLAFLQV